jgi:predicted AAA+ superfamily ATPase
MIERQLVDILKNRLEKFPILTLVGPRQSGKSTLLRNYFPDYEYINLERPDYRHLVMDDPIGFLSSREKGVIFDEAQQVPELFSYLQVVSDEKNRAGQYILSGSQSFLMNERISQSLAGRTSINRLFPFDISEIGLRETVFETIYTGFYPRIYDFSIEPNEFYPPYIQTYIERDVRTLRSIENLTTFTRFLALCAGRIGQTLNLTSLANDAGVSVNTAKSWLLLLEASFILFQLQPYYKNFNKRLIKSPKIYFYDTGVVCSLLNIRSAEMIQSHYLYGALFENFVIAEIIKLYA